jgi:MFS family permease
MLGLIVGGGVLTWLFVADGIRDVAFFLTTQLESLYFAEVGNLNPQQIGWLGAVNNTALVITLPVAGWLSDKISERRAIIIGLLTQSTGYFLLLRGVTQFSFAVSWAVLGIGLGIIMPAFEALISKAVPSENRGITYGLFWTSISLFTLPAPYLGSMMWERISPQAPFIFTGSMLIIAVLPVWLKLKLPPEKTDDDPSEYVEELT